MKALFNLAFTIVGFYLKRFKTDVVSDVIVIQRYSKGERGYPEGVDVLIPSDEAETSSLVGGIMAEREKRHVAMVSISSWAD